MVKLLFRAGAALLSASGCCQCCGCCSEGLPPANVVDAALSGCGIAASSLLSCAVGGHCHLLLAALCAQSALRFLVVSGPSELLAGKGCNQSCIFQNHMQSKCPSFRCQTPPSPPEVLNKTQLEQNGFSDCVRLHTLHRSGHGSCVFVLALMKHPRLL